MKKLRVILAVLIAVFALGLGGCKPKDNAETFHGVELPFPVYSDIIIEDSYLYTGQFPEDGSFSQKENVFAIKVSNESDKDLRLLRIVAVTDKKEMLFEITTLTAGSKITVFEKNGQTLEENEKIIDFKPQNRVDFEHNISIKEEKIELMTMDRVLNIKNISGKDISADVFVYYKKIDENGDYFGGITFRSRAQGLKNGELKQLPASNFDVQNSKVIFVDYQE